MVSAQLRIMPRDHAETPMSTGFVSSDRHNLEVGIMNPTPLVPGAGKDLIDCLPEAERAVPHGEIRRDLKPAPLDVDEELAPALRATNMARTMCHWRPPVFAALAESHHHTIGNADAPYSGSLSGWEKRSQRAV